MGVRITQNQEAVLYDSVTGKAFGPVFSNEFEADEFLRFTRDKEIDDVRTVSEDRFDDLYAEFVEKNEKEINEEMEVAKRRAMIRKVE